jgi:hypothetical protein
LNLEIPLPDRSGRFSKLMEGTKAGLRRVPALSAARPVIVGH